MQIAENSALLIDFDNTISSGDVLNTVIERFSPTRQWEQWQADWETDRISTLECLRLQVGHLDVDQATLMAHVREARIDPGFPRLQTWARANEIPLAIASDNFEPIVREILRHHGIEAPPVYANALAFQDRLLLPAFPYRSTTCLRCANCKATHFARFPGRRIIYVGDGLSDVCPALKADQVFAKDSLARYLQEHRRTFTPFANLDDVVRTLEQAAGGR